MSKVIKWESKGKYGVQTKTMWSIACSNFDLTTSMQGVKYSSDQINFIKSRLETIGYSDLSLDSVKMYMGALNASMIGERLAKTKSLQNDINTFRKQMGFPKIKF